MITARFTTTQEIAEHKAEERYTQALWYAWGHVDAGTPGLTIEDGWAFAREQRDAALSFYGDAQSSCYLDSIISAWDSFRARLHP